MYLLPVHSRFLRFTSCDICEPLSAQLGSLAPSTHLLFQAMVEVIPVLLGLNVF